MLFGHGDDHYNSQKEVKINFSSNVWHGADLRTLREHLNEQFYELTRYPEPDASSLKRLLARCYEVEEENIVVTNGSITAFYLLAQTWKGAKSAIAVPSFAEYEDACRLHGHEVSFFPTSCDLSGLSLEGQDFCWICNPNNPTGYLYTRREMNQIRDIVKKYDLYLFSDEVYREFIYTGSPYISACHLEGIEQNVVLIDSVSKRYSECGIRIGALITKNAEVRSAVMKFCQARLSPPLIGQIAAEASLDASEEYARETYDEYVERRKCLIDGLNRIPGVKWLRLREVISFSGFYGGLTDKNNPALDPTGLYRFPEGTSPMGRTPYLEASVGLENIFKILRIDYYRRLTYLDQPNIKKGGVRIALRFSF